MAGAIVVDTDVMVDYLRGRSEAVRFVKESGGQIILSSIVVAELYAGVKGEAEQATLDALIAVLRVAPVTPRIAKADGLLKREFAGSHGLGLADAIIAATAEAENAQLATLNVKHYPMIKGLEPPYRKR